MIRADQNRYGASSNAPSAYQTPRARLALRGQGRRAYERAAGRLPSPSPNPVVSAVMDTAVKTASTASAATAYPRESIVATRRTPTPALPRPRAGDRPRTRRRVPAVRVRVARAGSAWTCPRPRPCARARGRDAAPAQEQPDREAEMRTPTAVSAPCWSACRWASKRTSGRPNAKSVSACLAPRHAEPRGAAGGLLARRDERRHGREVIRIGQRRRPRSTATTSTNARLDPSVSAAMESSSPNMIVSSEDVGKRAGGHGHAEGEHDERADCGMALRVGPSRGGGERASPSPRRARWR